MPQRLSARHLAGNVAFVFSAIAIPRNEVLEWLATVIHGTLYDIGLQPYLTYLSRHIRQLWYRRTAFQVNIANRRQIPGREFAARRTSTNIVGGRSPVHAQGFCLGHVVLEPHGGQVPWHNHPQEEIYYLLTGCGEMCVDQERQAVVAGDVIEIGSGQFHQLTNTGTEPLEFIYCYAPAGDVAHWRQEIEGTLPIAGIEAPQVPDGSVPQYLSETKDSTR